MVIYGEYLFVENMIVGLVVLFFTGKFTGERAGRLRFVFCGIFCGLYAFVLFTPLSGMYSLTGKACFSLLIVRTAFGRKTVRQIIEKALIFFLLTVLYGGVALAVLTSFGWTGVTAVSGIYLPAASYMTIMAAGSCSAWMIWFFLDSIKVKRMNQRVLADAEVEFGNVHRTLKGLIDSGNVLKEPLTGRPVCVIGKTLMDEFLKEMKHIESRYTVIPYCAVGIEKGILDGYRAEWITVNGIRIKSPILAVCKEDAFFHEGEGFDILLPGSMLERGIHGDYSSDENLADGQILKEQQACILHRRE